MKIHKIHGRNTYCGPSAISAITGFSTDQASVAIRAHSGQRAVKGAPISAVLSALADFGVTASRTYSAPKGKGVTLTQWLKSSVKQRTSDRVFLLVAGWHYQIVSGRRYTCGRLREIVSIKSDEVKRRARVSHVFELTSASISKPNSISKHETERRVASRASAKRNTARTAARSLARKHSITIDIEGDSLLWVQACETTEKHADYPFDGDHYVHDWDEVMTRVEDIIKFEQSIIEA
jgi:hypothetical protein